MKASISNITKTFFVSPLTLAAQYPRSLGVASIKNDFMINPQTPGKYSSNSLLVSFFKYKLLNPFS